MKDLGQDPATGDRWLQWYGAAQAGSQPAADQLLREVRPFFADVLRKQARRRPSGAWDNSDVAQDCCVKLFSLPPGQEFRGSTGQEFIAWLRTIARRKALDAVRMEQAQKRGGDRPHGPLPGDSAGEVAIAAETSTPSQRLVRQEEGEALAAALARLSAEHQRVIQLRRSPDKLTWADVAQEMGSTEDAVKQLFRRAVKRLSDEMGATHEHRP